MFGPIVGLVGPSVIITADTTGAIVADSNSGMIDRSVESVKEKEKVMNKIAVIKFNVSEDYYSINGETHGNEPTKFMKSLVAVACCSNYTKDISSFMEKGVIVGLEYDFALYYIPKEINSSTQEKDVYLLEHEIDKLVKGSIYYFPDKPSYNTTEVSFVNTSPTVSDLRSIINQNLIVNLVLDKLLPALKVYIPGAETQTLDYVKRKINTSDTSPVVMNRNYVTYQTLEEHENLYKALVKCIRIECDVFGNVVKKGSLLK